MRVEKRKLIQKLDFKISIMNKLQIKICFFNRIEEWPSGNFDTKQGSVLCWRTCAKKTPIYEFNFSEMMSFGFGEKTEP